ncbi:RNA-guided endonuclease IscB [Photobacterium leiognathi]|uniref:RNA-guided endonuclease IscB n=2 Tax=Photobacterium leiognathi TaxID=553611 RepID=UPI002981F403|nr:RNA-guided endonuclease IscB [Photobacterium leiognathi]
MLYRGTVIVLKRYGRSTTSKALISGREEVGSYKYLKFVSTHNSKEKYVMFVFVLNKNGKALMPCKPQKARVLLKRGDAKVIKRTPFTIKLIGGSSGYKQNLIGGMDTGSKTIGCAVVGLGQVIYQSQVALRQDVTKKLEQRAMYRRNRRGRKCRYRPARWANRASMRVNGRLAPSLKSKLDSHLRERDFIESILPISEWKVETASFDIHKITNPDVMGGDYQDGFQKGFYNTKAYVLNRDGYKCKSARKGKHSSKLHVHHIVFRSKGGTDTPTNLITLCETCHHDLHAGKFELKARKSRTKHATEMGILKSRLKSAWSFTETFGYETKFKREHILNLAKEHYFDAVAICLEDGEVVSQNNIVYFKRHVSKGDYQLTKGARSEKRIPVGKLFGLKKHDLISTPQGTGFIKGKRSTGYFALETITGEKVHASANVKKNTVRVSARTTTLIQQMEAAIPPTAKAMGILAA